MKKPNVIARAGIVNVAPRNSRTSSIGCSRVSSHHTNPVPATTAPTNAARTGPLVHPLSGAWMNANTSDEMVTIDSAAPTRSRCTPSGSRDSGTSRTPRSSATITIGTFASRTDPHQKWVRRMPATGGPRMNPRPPTPDQIPIACCCSAGDGNTVVRIESVPGMIIAAPTPIAARAAISGPGVVAKAPSPDATPNTTRPMSRSRLRPTRSLIAPIVMTRPEKTIPYAAKIHCSSSGLAWRARTRLGIATFRIVTDIPTRISEMHRTPSVQYRRRSVPSVAATPPPDLAARDAAAEP